MRVAFDNLSRREPSNNKRSTATSFLFFVAFAVIASCYSCDVKKYPNGATANDKFSRISMGCPRFFFFAVAKAFWYSKSESCIIRRKHAGVNCITLQKRRIEKLRVGLLLSIGRLVRITDHDRRVQFIALPTQIITGCTNKSDEKKRAQHKRN